MNHCHTTTHTHFLWFSHCMIYDWQCFYYKLRDLRYREVKRSVHIHMPVRGQVGTSTWSGWSPRQCPTRWAVLTQHASGFQMTHLLSVLFLCLSILIHVILFYTFDYTKFQLFLRLYIFPWIIANINEVVALIMTCRCHNHLETFLWLNGLNECKICSLLVWEQKDLPALVPGKAQWHLSSKVLHSVTLLSNLCCKKYYYGMKAYRTSTKLILLLQMLKNLLIMTLNKTVSKKERL